MDIPKAKTKQNVSVLAQVLFSLIIPFASIYAFYRIEKLGRMIILGIIGFSLLMIGFFVIENNETLAGFLLVIGYFFMPVVGMYFLVKWSREWNKMTEDEYQLKKSKEAEKNLKSSYPEKYGKDESDTKKDGYYEV